MKWVETEPEFRYEEITELKSAIEKNPADAVLHYRLGQIYRRYYQPAAALNAFRQAVSLKPEMANYGISLADMLINHQDFIPALSLLNRIPDTKQTPLFRLSRIKIQIALGAMEKAIAEYERIASSAPEKSLALLKISRSLFKIGNYNTCLVLCEAQLAMVPFDTTALAMKAAALQALGEVDQLTELLDLKTLVAEFDTGADHTTAQFNRFNSAINKHLHRHKAFYNAKSAVQGYRLDLVDYSSLPEINSLKGNVQQGVSAYVEKLHASNSWFSGSEPQAIQLRSWGNISDKNGYKQPHFHPGGWLTAVYYSKFPTTTNGNGGFLELGRPPPKYSGTHPPLIKLIRPAEGKLVIFPSFLYHGTIPQQVEGKRISIAFDIRPAEY